MNFFDLEELRELDKEAISTEDISVSYKQLFMIVDSIEEKFKYLKIKKGERIVVCMENSIEMIACIIACLGFGVVLVPVDIDNSPQRIKSIIDECIPKLIILPEKKNMKKELCTYLPENFSTVFIDESLQNFQFIITNETVKIPTPPNSVYIVYTSGSTGRPKGVVIGYESLYIHTVNMLDIFRFSSNSKLLITSTLSFDAALGYVYYALQSKAAIHLFNSNLLMPRKIIKCINEFEITHYACTPSFLTKLIEYIEYDSAQIKSLKTLSFGAEKIKDYEIATINRFKNRNNNIRIFNRYGPTETTIASSVYEIMDTNKKYIPIGKPLPGVQYFIDFNGDDESGELYISGIQNMLGYFNDNVLTIQSFKFINGIKMYQTNDIVYEIGGDIIFVDRNDDMLKRDGKRIYLSEIDNIVRSIEGVKDSATLVDDENSRLVMSFIVSEGVEQKKMEQELRRSYRHYMIPDKIYIVDTIPRKKNMKIDKNELFKKIKK